MKDKYGSSIVEDNQGKHIYAKTENQDKLVKLIDQNQITFVDGPAGCGKTFIAVAKAVQLLRTGKYKKIILTRPAVESGESLGFLPGELGEKIAPYMTPLYEYLKLYFGKERNKVQGDHPSRYKDKKAKQRRETPQEVKQTVSIGDFVEVVPLAFMRGMTFNESIVLVDEAQNITKKQMIMLLTRIGFCSKMIITGDQSQRDIDSRTVPGFFDAIDRLDRIPGIASLEFGDEDIVRNGIIQDILKAYSE